jgi:hypothetical protein
MIEEQIIKFADLLDSIARPRPEGRSKNEGEERRKERRNRLTFDEIINKLKKDEAAITKLFTTRLHAILFSILEGYKDSKNAIHIPSDIKLLLGINQEKAKPRRKHDPSSDLSFVLDHTIKVDGKSTTNRWVVVLAVIVKSNALGTMINEEGIATLYVGEPKFKVAVPNISEAKLECNGDYYRTAELDGLVAVTFRRSASDPNLFFGSFLLNASKPREISYAICAEINEIEFVSSMSVAFCDNAILSSSVGIKRLRNVLVSSMRANSRWQLIPASDLC